MKPAGGSGSGHWQLWALLLCSCCDLCQWRRRRRLGASVMERARIWFEMGSIPLLRWYLVGAVRSSVSRVP